MYLQVKGFRGRPSYSNIAEVRTLEHAVSAAERRGDGEYCYYGDPAHGYSVEFQVSNGKAVMNQKG